MSQQNSAIETAWIGCTYHMTPSLASSIAHFKPATVMNMSDPSARYTHAYFLIASISRCSLNR